MAITPTRLRTAAALLLGLCALALPACHRSHAEEHAHPDHHAANKLIATSPQVRDVVVTQQYVCRIESRRHIVVRAQHKEAGYLEEIKLREGQAVKAGDVLFRIVPVLYKTSLDVELAEVRLAQLEYENTLRLANDKVVSKNELAIYEAKLLKAQARAKEAEAKLNLTVVRAPFDGIIDRLHEQQGSLIKEGDKLTTLSDNTVMWVYFNVPESRYFEYKARDRNNKEPSRIELADSRVELVLANGATFPHDAGSAVTVEGEFHVETGNIPFRADFPN
ncbi:MAG: efflux RND transporter periplasmic adaptor subunit, partial [Gemmataceae bacterium]|nr:efflux RND transporter periplasmic adaptor subunit [Gemmataceae bacterium]